MTIAIISIIFLMVLLVIDRGNCNKYKSDVRINDYVEVLGSDSIQGLVTNIFKLPFDNHTYYVIDVSSNKIQQLYPYHSFTRIYNEHQVARVSNDDDCYH